MADKTNSKFPEKLFACWHPVGYSHEIKKDEPFGTFLLDEAIVLWRTTNGCLLYTSDAADDLTRYILRSCRTRTK